jgi:hypothetical protein
MKKLIRLGRLFLLLATVIAITSSFPRKTSAQTGDIVWNEPVNISNSPELTSTDPFLLADPAGLVHLFWAERSSAGVAQNPDTLLYAYWDGEKWSKPIDIFFSPDSDGNPTVSYPHAVLDDNGRIHLFWISEPNYPYYALNYSSVEAGQAKYASAWQPKVILADDLTGTKYSIHVAYSPPDTLHVVYASGAQGSRPKEDRTVHYIRSTDLGKTWSKPVVIFTSPVLLMGVSDTRLLFVPPNTLYASWTLWDDTGNGKRIYFTRSQDSGITWDAPVVLTENRDDEYERDWNNMVQLDKNLLMTIWEGGWRAYRNAQYSLTEGSSWSDPIDIFPRLIGDNGYVEFVKDSNNKWHAFLAQRIREGNEGTGQADAVFLWESSWLGGTGWSDPVQAISGESTRAMTNPKVAIVNGNRIVATWYGSGIYEVMVATGVIQDAPYIPPKPWPASVEQPINIPTDVMPTPLVEITLQPTPTPYILKPVSKPGANEPFNFAFGVASSLIVSLIMVVIVVVKRRT